MRRIYDALRQDVTFAIRALTRSPGLVATVVITLGLGVGANAAVFTALDRVFFQAPPGVRDPATLRRLYAHQVSSHTPQFGPEGRVTPFLTTRDMTDLAAAVQPSGDVQGYDLDRGAHTMPDSQRILISYVTPGYLDMLGVRMDRGRPFARDEFRVPGAPLPVLILSDAYWRRRFGADPDVIGKSLRIDNSTYTIIGVAAREFEGLELESVDAWAPLSNDAAGDITWLRVVMRLAPGANARFVDERLSTQYRETHHGDRQVETGSEIVSAPILAARGPRLSGVSVLRIPGMSERSIAMLARLGIIGIVVLAIAIANVASLLLMRAVRQKREIAVRMALGVSAVRLVSQQVAESILLSALAGAAALGAAALTGGVLRRQLAAGIRWTSTVVDERVVVLGMACALMAGCLAGVAPALFALRTDVSGALKASRTNGGRTGTRIRSALLVIQASLCMALLASAGVILQSLRRAGQTDRGFDTDRTLLLSIPANYASAESDLARIASALRALPEVEAVGRSLTGLADLGFRSKVGLSASDTIGEGPQGPWIDFVGAEWGRAAGVRVIGGRMLDSSTAVAPVAVINEAMARALYRGRNVAGTCIRVREPHGVCREVIGVIRDVRWDLSSSPPLRVYLPLIEAWTRPNAALVPNHLVIRTRPAASKAELVRLRGLVQPMMPPDNRVTVQRVADMLEPQLRPWRLAVTLFLILGALGLAAAAAGIHGLVAYDVAQRRRELGVRIALGAPRAHVVGLVVGSALRVVMLGEAAGCVAALLAGRVMMALLYGTSPYDPVTLVMTGAVLAFVSIVASLRPAWRATHTDPIVALAAD